MGRGFLESVPGRREPGVAGRAPRPLQGARFPPVGTCLTGGLSVCLPWGSLGEMPGPVLSELLAARAPHPGPHPVACLLDAVRWLCPSGRQARPLPWLPCSQQRPLLWCSVNAGHPRFLSPGSLGHGLPQPQASLAGQQVASALSLWPAPGAPWGLGAARPPRCRQVSSGTLGGGGGPRGGARSEDSCVLLFPAGCGGCGSEIRNGQALVALDKHWHLGCFKCQTCGKLLSAEYISK